MTNDPLDTAVRHQLMIQRYGDFLAKESQPYIDRVLSEVAAVLSSETLESMPRRRVEALYKQINRIVDSSYAEWQGGLTKQLDMFGGYEKEFSAELLAMSASVELAQSKIVDSFVDTLMNVKPGVQISIQEALAEFGVTTSRDIVRAVSDGHLAGETSQIVTRRVADLAPMKRAQAGTLVRTMVNAISTQARQETLIDNADILKGYKWVATLDSRTSLICASRDGMLFPLDSLTKPPAHYGCRSTIVPVVKDEYNIGLSGERPALNADGVSQVSNKTTYGQWLNRQPAAFQDEILGDTRAALFRRGGLSIDAFVDKTGRTYTLDALKRLHPLAFERANLN